MRGLPSQNTFQVSENCGKGGDARELRQEIPGAVWDNGREGGAGHTLIGPAGSHPPAGCGYSPTCGTGHINSS